MKNENYISPIGRIVGGSLYFGNDKDYHGRPLITKDGENYKRYVIYVAFAKDNPELPALKQYALDIAIAEFPHCFNNGVQIVPDFYWKCRDGDTTELDDQGNPYSDREGYRGHEIWSFRRFFDGPPIMDPNGQVLIQENLIMPGDYIRVSCQIRGNSSSKMPGLFVDMKSVEFQGVGNKIISDNSAYLFKQKKPVYIPQGMRPFSQAATNTPPQSQQPVVNSSPQNYVLPKKQEAPMMQTASLHQPPAAPSQIAPVAPAIQPPQAASVIPMSQPPVTSPQASVVPQQEQYLVNGSWFSTQQLFAAGWSDEQLIGLQRRIV